MRIITLNCPNCGAPFNPPTSKNICYCSSCGTKMLIDNGQIVLNINQTSRFIDEAKMLKETEKTKRSAERLKVVYALICLLASAFLIFIAHCFK